MKKEGTVSDGVACASCRCHPAFRAKGQACGRSDPGAASVTHGILSGSFPTRHNSNPPFERLLSCSPVVPPRRLTVARFSPSGQS